MPALSTHALEVFATSGFEFAGVHHGPIELAVFAVGWACGWLLLARPRRLPPLIADSLRPPVAVVVPARDEERSLPHLLERLEYCLRDGDQLVVVDDHSTDRTAEIARSFGADVTTPPPPRPGWLGKPNACWHGANTTDAPVLVFLDADVRPGPALLDELAAATTQHPGEVVSMQPWHAMPTWREQPSILCNVTALMGCGAFTVLGGRGAANVAFGPVIAIDRDTYDHTGGHSAEPVRSRHTEDIGIARLVGRSRLFVGAPDATTFRMYPTGLRELIGGWTRSIATGARFTPWWLALLTFAWVCSVAGGWLAAPLVYPLTAMQLWVLGRRAGTTRPLAALCFPVLVVVFTAIFLRSAFAIVFKRDVSWKGRQVDARTG